MAGSNLEHSARVLEPIEKTMQADGMGLSLEEGSRDGALKVELILSNESCLECLVPRSMLLKIIEKRLTESGVAYPALDLRYPDPTVDSQGAEGTWTR